MAARMLCLFAFLAVVSVSAQAAKLNCEDLAVEDCAYSVSGSGSRCVLEKYVTADRNVLYQCQASPVTAERPEAWIETDECLSACGLQRMSVGMSTDGLVQKEFLNKWCSPACQENCPNVVDLFIKLAAGEDVHLPHICTYLRPSSRRLIGFTPMSKGTRLALESLEVAQAPQVAQAPESIFAMNSELFAPVESPLAAASPSDEMQP